MIDIHAALADAANLIPIPEATAICELRGHHPMEYISVNGWQMTREQAATAELHIFAHYARQKEPTP